MIAKASSFKATGNLHFTARPPELDLAVAAYKSALDHLPPCKKKPPIAATSPATGIAEVTEEEASAIEKEADENGVVDTEKQEREEVEDEVRECTKACWGNLAACYISMVS